MSAIILFRSMTQAQRGVQVLSAGGVPATVARAPREISDKGCTFGARLAEKRLETALRALEREDVRYGKVFLPAPDGTYREAQG